MIKRVNVINCNDKNCNGVYKLTKKDFYKKDNTHHLYRWKGDWRLANYGVKVYYILPECKNKEWTLKELNFSRKSIEENYLIYKASGGIAHMLRTLSTSIYSAKKFNRYLIIDTKSHKAFGVKFSDFFVINDKNLRYSCDYKVIPKSYKFKNISIKKIENIGVKYNKGKYYLHIDNLIINVYKENNLFPRLDIISPGLKESINTKIKVVSSIREKFEKKSLQKKYIATHFRNTDIKNNINDFIRKIKNVLRTTKIRTLYLATDDYSAYNILQKNLPNIEIIQYTKPGNFGGKNIHYSTKDNYQQVFNCLLDIYMILRSDIFIPSFNSGLSKWIIQMIKRKDSIF